MNELYRVIGRQAIQLKEVLMSNDRWRELAANSVPSVLGTERKWSEQEALSEIQQRLKTTPEEASMLLRAASEKFPLNVDFIYRALGGTQ